MPERRVRCAAWPSPDRCAGENRFANSCVPKINRQRVRGAAEEASVSENVVAATPILRGPPDDLRGSGGTTIPPCYPNGAALLPVGLALRAPSASWPPSFGAVFPAPYTGENAVGSRKLGGCVIVLCAICGFPRPLGSLGGMSGGLRRVGWSRLDPWQLAPKWQDRSLVPRLSDPQDRQGHRLLLVDQSGSPMPSPRRERHAGRKRLAAAAAASP